ncbi:MAG: YdcH family protein [Acidobacteriota bacterium]
MEQTNEELKAHLMATDGHFRSLIEEHALFHKQLEQLEAKEQLTLADEEVEHRLKKHKLRLKDEINMILSRTQQMA